MKYVNFTLKEMTPEQMKINPIKPIIKVKTNEEIDTEEGESNTDKMNKNPPYQSKRKMNILHFQTGQNKILNQTLMLMRLNIKKLHIHLKHCKTT